MAPIPWDRRQLRSSPTKRHDFDKLELLGAWESLSSSGPFPVGKREETPRVVSHRDKAYKE